MPLEENILRPPSHAAGSAGAPTTFPQFKQRVALQVEGKSTKEAARARTL